MTHQQMLVAVDCTLPGKLVNHSWRIL